MRPVHPIPDIKYVVVGDAAVGKTCLLNSMTSNCFLVEYTPNVFDTYNTSLMVDGKPYSVNGWDTAAQSDYDRLRPLSYPSTHVFLVCFSLVVPTSLQSVRDKWFPEIFHHVPDAAWILVGTMSDLVQERQAEGRAVVTQEQAWKFAAELNVRYMETSARELLGTKELLEGVVRAYIWNIDGRPPIEPERPKTPAAPVLTVPASTFAEDLRAVYNNESSLPDIQFSFGTEKDRHTILAHTIILSGASFAFKEAMNAAFSSISINGGTRCYEVKSEYQELIDEFLRIIYMKSKDAHLRTAYKLASILALRETDVLSVTSELPNSAPPQQLTEPPRKGLGLHVDVIDLSDIHFLCSEDDRPLYAHRAVLAMRCERFRALFASGMADSRRKALTVDYTRRTMHILLQYLYRDEYSDHEAQSVLVAANEYGLDRLRAMAALSREITPDNMLDTFELAVTHNCNPLAEYCLHLMRCNWQNVYSKRPDVKARLSPAQYAEIKATQHPPPSYYAAMEKWRLNGTVLRLRNADAGAVALHHKKKSERETCCVQ